MAITYSAKGTSYPSFTVGKNGVTIHQGTSAPTSQGVDGDIFFQAGATPKLWQKADDEWNEIGNFGSKVAFEDTSVDTNLVANTITLTADGSRVLDVAHDVLSVGGEKAILKNGASQITLSVVDTSTTNAMDLVIDLQGQGALKVQSDADAAIRTSDGSDITFKPGDKTSGTGGNVNVYGGDTSAVGSLGGNVVLTPGTGGAGTGKILVSTDYYSSDENSVVSRLNQTTLMTVVVTTDATHNVAQNEQLILVNRTTSATTTVVLPSTSNTGKVVRVKDAKGEAGTQTITINVSGGGNIDGTTSKTITTAYGSLAFLWSGTQWLTL